MGDYNRFAEEAAKWFFAPHIHKRRRTHRKLTEIPRDQIDFWLREYGWRPGLLAAKARGIKKKVYEILTYLPNVGGAPARLGPHLSAEAAQELEQWERGGQLSPCNQPYVQNGSGLGLPVLFSRRFSCDLTWPQTPQLFRDRFEGLWSSWEPDGKSFALGAYETQFFQGWSLDDLLRRYGETVKLGNEIISSGKRPIIESRPTKGGNSLNTERRLRASVSEVETVRAIEFERLSQHFRIFCFPKHQRLSGKLIRDTFDGWRDEMLKQKKPKAEILGTPTQWDILLNVEDAMSAGLTSQEALKWSYLLHWKVPTEKQKGGDAFVRRLCIEDNSVLFKAEDRWPSWQRDYEAMNSSVTGSGWIQKVFPTLRL